ncbi:MAG: hypothetical protein HON68_11085 [Gammaproteobacteria bacterium]|jgi:hypothetical protein|nr:hypothetical protein [Gammaproteobacteria bacterium]MBT3488526.1 hypothetical protein [Gammaproteobacteria bacterium]MBT3717341.1 hypothetical protein [Gammaproteobacteria bacterium]MBT3845153.1 hypothetical protein [Gammaproteobacteria bacterium]MBT3893419.1 hypothetical protein [Gammaproteobacteria bacterium]
MRIRFNHNTRDELVDGELLQDRSIDVRVTELDIPFLSLIWLMVKLIAASTIATLIIGLILMVVGVALNFNFHTIHL